MMFVLYALAIRLIRECLRAESADFLVVYWGMSTIRAVPGELAMGLADLVATLAGIPRLGSKDLEP